MLSEHQIRALVYKTLDEIKQTEKRKRKNFINNLYRGVVMATSIGVSTPSFSNDEPVLPASNLIDQHDISTVEDNYTSTSTEIQSVVNFNKGKLKLTKFHKERLDKVISVLQPDDRIIITGYADSSGNYDYNLGLAQIRGNQVADYFMKHGVKVLHVDSQVSIGVGWENRKVDIKIMHESGANRQVQLDSVQEVKTSSDQVITANHEKVYENVDLSAKNVVKMEKIGVNQNGDELFWDESGTMVIRYKENS